MYALLTTDGLLQGIDLLHWRLSFLYDISFANKFQGEGVVVFGKA